MNLSSLQSFQLGRRTHYILARVWNLGRRIVAGLPIRSECVWPGVQNDLFVAHFSIYRFFTSFASKKRVLDAGCGTGYGSMELLRGNPERVLGIDVEPRNIKFASRRYRHPRLEFQSGDCEQLQLDPCSKDLIVSSNVMEHLKQPHKFLKTARSALSKNGQIILVIPPIVDQHSLAMNQANPYHRANLSVDEWLTLFEDCGLELVHIYSQTVRQPDIVDFSSPFCSNVTTDSFSFQSCDRNGLYRAPVLGAAYVLKRLEKA